MSFSENGGFNLGIMSRTANTDIFQGLRLVIKNSVIDATVGTTVYWEMEKTQEQ